MIRKLLIANRGEIACRIIRTAKRMGIRTVAVYSDADAGAMHVAAADEAVRIGPAPVGESYLQGQRIIEAARETGADAIHPGYGFLSENPDFVDAVSAAGLVFVGPSASAIRAMGLKDAAKRLMTEAGVPVVPGYHGDERDPAFLAAEAERIGYPVLIKARAGGGGKGMRRVDRPEDFSAALAGAEREGQAAFGDPVCLIEKYVSTPRHIEIQVFGDAHGNAVHLFERDCSLQRRHQKVIEEAPAPGMPEAMRAAMGAAAVKAAKAIAYSGAGTIEFIVDASDGLREDRFYFMEMNTRLQVEHPVTEAITGLDLVEWQLRVASGEALPLAQGDLRIHGHAFEARLYAEDPTRGFLPATGRLEHLRFPDDARIDTGVREGDAITPFYDPMIAKIIVHGTDRAEALGRLGAALAQTEVAGLTTNVAFLAALAHHEGFARGEVDTGLIERDTEALTASTPASAEVYAIAALAELGAFEPVLAADPFEALRDFRLFGAAERSVRFVDSEGPILVRARRNGAVWSVETPVGSLDLRVVSPQPRPRVAVGDRTFEVGIARRLGHVALFSDGRSFDLALHRPGAGASEAASGDRVVSPMPGTVRLVSASTGDTVVAGAALVVVEAMKMEHTLRAPRDGIVAEILVSVGDQVSDGMLLVSLEPQP